MKLIIHDIFLDTTIKDVEKVYNRFVEILNAKHPKANKCLHKDKDLTVALYSLFSQILKTYMNDESKELDVYYQYLPYFGNLFRKLKKPSKELHDVYKYLWSLKPVLGSW